MHFVTCFLINIENVNMRIKDIIIIHPTVCLFTFLTKTFFVFFTLLHGTRREILVKILKNLQIVILEWSDVHHSFSVIKKINKN